RLNEWVAITVVVMSVFLAIGNVKDGNIGQNMALAKADAVDAWNEYQAGRIKLHMDEDMLAQLKLNMVAAGADRTAISAEMTRLQKQIDKYVAKSGGLMKKAQANEALYEKLNLHDDQFDMSEALLSIAMALAAVAALTAIEWVLIVGWVFGGFGLLMGTAGFLGWSLHPDFLARMLG
ncbi:MAG TPA: DUF4337 domain-containing protein, partial [Rhizomicrobium sp.]